jgi:hypothetical protein
MGRSKLVTVEARGEVKKGEEKFGAFIIGALLLLALVEAEKR